MNLNPDLKRVAILKSRIYRGGVAQVLGHMIKTLNELEIIPELLTLRCDLTEKDFENLYQLEIKFKIKLIGPDLKMPYEWHFLYFNLLSRHYANKYDLFINSNNTSFLGPKKIKTITYVHYPRKERVLSKCQSIHFPEEKNKTFLDISFDPFYFAKFLYRFDASFGLHETVLANSNFTRDKIKNCYPSYKNEIEVLFPPVEMSKQIQSNKKNQIVTLGRITKDKRQLEQIQIGLKKPDIPMYILGFTNYDGYYKKCLELIEANNAKHIHLLPNLSKAEIHQILDESLIFLHNVRNEPFGIGIVEAINHGCIPLVHSSGGGKEIVNNENLIFETTGEAQNKIKEIMENKTNFIFNSDYSPQSFYNKFNKVLDIVIQK